MGVEMAKCFSRRDFLKTIITINGAVAIEVVFQKTGLADAQNNIQPENDALIDVIDNPHASDLVSIHHKPSVIYIKG